MTQERLLRVSEQNEIEHRPGVYLITVDDHVNQWGSTNLNQDGEYALVWHRECNMSKNQMSSNHLCLQLNQTHMSERRLSEGNMTTSKHLKAWAWLDGSR